MRSRSRVAFFLLFAALNIVVSLACGGGGGGATTTTSPAASASPSPSAEPSTPAPSPSPSPSPSASPTPTPDPFMLADLKGGWRLAVPVDIKTDSRIAEDLYINIDAGGTVIPEPDVAMSVLPWPRLMGGMAINFNSDTGEFDLEIRLLDSPGASTPTIMTFNAALQGQKEWFTLDHTFESGHKLPELSFGDGTFFFEAFSRMAPSPQHIFTSNVLIVLNEDGSITEMGIREPAAGRWNVFRQALLLITMYDDSDDGVQTIFVGVPINLKQTKVDGIIAALPGFYSVLSPTGEPAEDGQVVGYQVDRSLTNFAASAYAGDWAVIVNDDTAEAGMFQIPLMTIGTDGVLPAQPAIGVQGGQVTDFDVNTGEFMMQITLDDGPIYLEGILSPSLNYASAEFYSLVGDVEVWRGNIRMFNRAARFNWSEVESKWSVGTVTEIAMATGTTSFCNFQTDAMGVITTDATGYSFEGSVIRTSPTTFSFMFGLTSESVTSYYWVVGDLIDGARSSLTCGFYLDTGFGEPIADQGYIAMYSGSDFQQQYYAGYYSTNIEDSPTIQVTWNPTATRLETTMEMIPYHFELLDSTSRLFDLKDNTLGIHIFYLVMMPDEVASLFSTVYGCIPATTLYAYRDNSPR